MESAQAKVVHTFFSHVHAVEEKFNKLWVCGVGENAVFKDVSRGWFVLYTNSWEWLYIGTEKPSFKVGDRVKITQEKVE